MTFKRLLMPLMVAGMVLTLTTSMAFGQASPINCAITVPQGATGTATATGHTEPVGAGTVAIPLAITAGGTVVVPATPEAGGGTVRVSCTNTSAAAFNPGVVVLTVGFATPITNTQTFPSSTLGIRVMRGFGDFVAAGPTTGNTTGGANVGISTTSNANGTVVIGLGTSALGGSTSSGLSGGTTATNPINGISFGAGVTSTFDLEGVLLSTNGKTGNVLATLVATGGVNITGGSVEAITAIKPGLVDPVVATGSLPAAVLAIVPPPGFVSTGIGGGAAVLNSSGGAVKNNFTIRIQENYESMFKESTQFNSGGTFPVSTSSDTQLLLVFNNIPSGFDISGCSALMTDQQGNPVGGSPSASQTNITSTSPIVTINFNAPVDQAIIDVVWLTCAKVTVGTATLPLPSTPITAQVTLGAVGTGLSATGTAQTGLTTGMIPRYQQLLQPTTAMTVVVFPPANTNLILSFGFVGPGYNTGISLANTTTDPFTPSGGGAAASAGTVTFTMMKNDGTSKAYTTTTGSPGSGLTGAGVVATGSTYVVNLSELLSAAAFGTTFTGHIFITTNFTHAHGASTIYTTSTGAAALSSPVLVLPAVSSAAPRGVPESLGQ